MKAKVVITMPIDAVDEADARGSVLSLVAEWVHRPRHTPRLQEIESWLRQFATIEVIPEPAHADHR